jgi:hypothetical protein
MDLVDLEFLELGCLTGKKWSGAVFGDLELRGALPNTPLYFRIDGVLEYYISILLSFTS